MRRFTFVIGGLVLGLAWLLSVGSNEAVAQGSPAIIIYSHGTVRPQKAEDCNADYNRVPDSLTRLEQRGLARIRFLCSTATDDDKEQGTYIYKRAGEIGREVDLLRARGARARDIFLAGHSAGAWSSLMFMSSGADRVNAAILFAPACCGPRSERDVYPQWLKVIQPRQVSEITSGKIISALVFAYSDDPFNRPQDLGFLTKTFPNSIRLIAEACGAGHLTHLSDCQGGQTADEIEKYLAARR